MGGEDVGMEEPTLKKVAVDSIRLEGAKDRDLIEVRVLKGGNIHKR